MLTQIVSYRNVNLFTILPTIIPVFPTYSTNIGRSFKLISIFSRALLVCLIPFSDAPLSIYGQSGGVLSDSVSSIALYGMLGDGCVDNKDCFVDNSVCNDKGKCSCLPDFTQTPGNSGSCQGKLYNPIIHKGEYQQERKCKLMIVTIMHLLKD